MPWVRPSRSKFVAMMGTEGMTAPRPVKTPPTSTTTEGIVHNKEAWGGTYHVHYFMEVTISTLLLIRSNQPSLRELVLGQTKINENINKNLWTMIKPWKV